jgi:hypothetical protein
LPPVGDPLDSMTQTELEEVIGSFPDTFRERKPVFRKGNAAEFLSLWQQQLRAGKRTRLTTDPQWRAACYAAAAADFRRMNLESAAVEMEREAFALFPEQAPADVWQAVADVADRKQVSGNKKIDPFRALPG